MGPLGGGHARRGGAVGGTAPLVYRLVEPAIPPDWSDGLVTLRSDLAEGGEANLRAVDAFTSARIERWRC
ncbi:MAG: hypothetical protein EOP83_29895 [Verrucomicrobiaceae bacterium]|nr:MAG: hypothetical protein EOP83_29895 [Verrucomicrobiaceae bacterium]